jgi:hypothetical protein
LIPGFKLLRRFALAFAILAILFLGVSIGIQRIAERKIGDAIKTSFGLSKRPSVHISGFPILLRVLQREIPKVTIVADDVVREGLRLRTVTLELESVSASGSLTGSGPLSASIARGTASAVVDEDDLNKLLHDRGSDARVRFRLGGTSVRAVATFGGEKHTITASGDMKLDGDMLKFAPDAKSVRVDGDKPDPLFAAEARRRTTVTIRVPQLPFGIKIGIFETRDGDAVMSADMAGKSIRLRR